MTMQDAIKKVVARQDLTAGEMTAAMQLIMTGQATDAQIGGLLIGLQMKGETVEEISAAAQVMRNLYTPVPVTRREGLVDTCGTGGDGSALFNVSTAAAIVVAAAGGRVAKHGNRSVSSKSGSADLLEAAGVRLDLTPEQVARCIDEVGVGFMFAPAHHGAMKYAIGPRREMAVRTVFNLLGPLTNPAGAPNQVMGVFSKALLKPIAEVLQKLGSHHVMVVHSDDGLDEISVAAPTAVAELRNGQITEYVIEPALLGVDPVDLESLKVTDAESSLRMIRRAFRGEAPGAADMIALNAGAAIYVSGITNSLKAGVDLAQDCIGSGLALAKLEELASFSQCFGD